MAGEMEEESPTANNQTQTWKSARLTDSLCDLSHEWANEWATGLWGMTSRQRKKNDTPRFSSIEVDRAGQPCVKRRLGRLV